MRRAAWLLVACLAAACKKDLPPEPQARDGAHDAAAGHDDEPDHPPLPKAVRLAPEVLASAKVKSEVVSRGALATTVSLPGELVADPDRSARIASPVAGRLDSVRLREGETVAKGAPVAVVRVPEIGRVRAAYAAATARARAARASATRSRELFDKRLGSEQAALDAEAEAMAIESEAKAIGEQLASIGTNATVQGATLTLTSPIAGVVVSRRAVVGQPVAADDTLATIAELSEVWFLGRVFEKDLGRLRVGSDAEVTLNAYPAERFSGHVELIGRQVDPVARTLTARVRLVNRDDLLRIGLFGTAQVTTPEPTAGAARIIVPRSALTEVLGKTVVFVQQPDGDFELHQVTLGRSAPGRVEIEVGLREGERVVTEGVFTIKSALLKSTLAEED